jgi:hypothetical protein
MRIHNVFHVSLLEPHKQSSIPNRPSPAPTPVVIEIEDDDDFEVDYIVDSRFAGSQLQYLVHWKGFTVADRTWEPAANLDSAPRCVDKFHSRYPSKPRPAAAP